MCPLRRTMRLVTLPYVALILCAPLGACAPSKHVSGGLLDMLREAQSDEFAHSGDLGVDYVNLQFRILEVVFGKLDDVILESDTMIVMYAYDMENAESEGSVWTPAGAWNYHSSPRHPIDSLELYYGTPLWSMFVIDNIRGSNHSRLEEMGRFRPIGGARGVQVFVIRRGGAGLSVSYFAFAEFPESLPEIWDRHRLRKE